MEAIGELVLPSLPSGLIAKPALIWKTDGNPSDKVQVSYLSRGFYWAANYVAVLTEEGLHLIGWAKITNQSGMTFENTRIKLIAGEVNRVVEAFAPRDRLMVEDSAGVYDTEAKPFFDYHMYTLAHQTILKDNQSKQIEILSGTAVPYQRYYKLGLFEEKADIIIEFQNRKEEGLGVAMPQGKVKLYKEDDDGALEFIGEDEIDHTPKNEPVTLSIGKAFDLVFDYQKIAHKKVGGVEYYTYRCRIKNHKESEAEVRFQHYRQGVWEILRTTHEYLEVSADQIEYRVFVPSEGEVAVEFEYKVDRRVEVNIKNR